MSNEVRFYNSELLLWFNGASFKISAGNYATTKVVYYRKMKFDLH